MNAQVYPASVDVAIVGSGPAGATYARILSEQSPDSIVAMFEVGPTVSEPPGAHVKNIADPAERQRAQSLSAGPGVGAETVADPGAMKSGQRRGRPGTFLLESGYQVDGEDGMPVVAFSSNVGGMAAHWTGACPRPGGSERIPFIHEMDALLDEAERLLGVTSQAFDASPYAKVVRERLSRFIDAGRTAATRVQSMPLAVHRRDDGRLVWSGADVVLGDVTRANPHFSLFDDSLVTKVLLVDGRAVGVEVRDRKTDTVHTVRASVVVVAADSLRTPQVLWASGIRPRALGRYLNDQAQVVFASRIRDDGLTASNATESGAVSTGLSEQSGVSWVPFTDELPFHGQIMQLDASPVPLAEDDPAAPGSIVGLGLFCAKDLQETDRVEFSETQKDVYGMPAMTIHYTLTARDREVIARASEEIVRLGEVVGEPLDDHAFTLPLGSSLHYQGSVRMGEEEDGMSVCSPLGEVWGTEGVFVAGNGVIPTATACNPTLTSVALAVRGAREVVRRLDRASASLSTSRESS